MTELKESYNKIYKEKIYKIDRNIDSINRYNIIHYELYDKRFNWNNENSIITILIPIKYD